MYPYPELIPLLKLKCEPEEYKRLGYSYRNQNGLAPRKDPNYLQIIPSYLYARCPICQTDCYAKIDTYNLRCLGFLDTKLRLDGGFILSPDYPYAYQPTCEHFLGTHSFRNLHDIEPFELGEQSEFPIHFMNGEAPLITPWFVRDDVESYAILHALPCCRIEQNKFVPSYTLFILTYFSSQPRLLINLHYAEEFKTMEEDSEYYPLNVQQPFANVASEEAGSEYDLSHWAAQGKLGCLDYRESDLPLLIGKDTILPEIYRDIKGRRYSFLWYEGKFKKA
jgi:hypothetical protein